MLKNVLLTFATLATITAHAQEFSYEYEGQTLCYSITDPNAKVCKVRACSLDGSANFVSGSLVIPPQVSNLGTEYTVTEIEGEAFLNNTEMRSVIIPATVTKVGDYAFRGCNGLKKNSCAEGLSVQFPIGIVIRYDPANSEIVNGYVYKNNRTELIFAPLDIEGEHTVPETVEIIGEEAYFYCESITHLTIPASVTTIGNLAFSYCNGLQSCLIGKNVVKAGRDLFYNAKIVKMAKPLTVANTSGYATTTITYDASKTEIVDGVVFSNDFETVLYAPMTLQGLYTLPDKVKYVGDNAFCHCADLTEIRLPGSLSTIGANSFKDCNGLVSITIPESVTQIGNIAFADCSGLSSAILPNSINNIPSGLFQNCTRLSTITLPNSITTIENSAFFGCKSLERVDFSHRLSKIGNSAFAECTGLKTVVIPNSVTLLERAAFYNCSGIETLTLGNSIASIKDKTFRYCSSLKSVIIPPSVERIEEYAFADCSNLETVAMGHRINAIANNVFDGCPLTDVKITAQIPPVMPDNAFGTQSFKLGVHDYGDNTTIDKYNADGQNWAAFDKYSLVAPTALNIEGNRQIKGKAGECFEFAAKLEPDNVSLPHVFWVSTNPDIATVDHDGVVTLHVDTRDLAISDADDATTQCKIIAESLYGGVNPVEIDVIDNDSSAIEDIVCDSDDTYCGGIQVYDMSGRRVVSSIESLSRGLYIVRQGTSTRKIAVK